MKCYICQCEVHIPVIIKCFPCHKINNVHCNTYTRFCYECMVRFLQLNQSVGSRISSVKCLTCSETINPNHLNFNNSFEYDFLLHQMKIGLKHKCPYCFLDFDNKVICFDYIKFAVQESRLANKLAFANHLFVSLESEPQLISRKMYS